MWAIDYKIEQALANFKMFPSFFLLLLLLLLLFFFFHVNLYAKEPAILVGQEPTIMSEIIGFFFLLG